MTMLLCVLAFVRRSNYFFLHLSRSRRRITTPTYLLPRRNSIRDDLLLNRNLLSHSFPSLSLVLICSFFFASTKACLTIAIVKLNFQLFSASFFVICFFSSMQKMEDKMFTYVWQFQDSNLGLLVSEVTALSSVPQSLPQLSCILYDGIPFNSSGAFLDRLLEYLFMDQMYLRELMS